MYIVYKGQELTEVCFYQNLASVDAFARLVTGQRGPHGHRINFGLAVCALFSLKRDSLLFDKDWSTLKGVWL
jgi:hypothetical protein